MYSPNMTNFVSGLFITSPGAFDTVEEAPPGVWGLKCECGHWVNRFESDPTKDKYDRDFFLCSGTHRSRKMLPIPALLREDVELVKTPTTVFSRLWWHATTSPLDQINPATLIHLGSRSSALNRAVFLRTFSPVEPVALYSFSLSRETSTIENRIIVEQTHGVTIEELHNIQVSVNSPRVHRYINVREAPGSISLLVDAGAVQNHEKVDEFPHLDAKS